MTSFVLSSFAVMATSRCFLFLFHVIPPAGGLLFPNPLAGRRLSFGRKETVVDTPYDPKFKDQGLLRDINVKEDR